VGRAADPVPDIETVDLTELLRRIGDARLVLLGAGSHGTSEYYQMRQRITRELIQRENFRFIAAEVGKADGKRVDAYVRRGRRAPDEPRQTFNRFPTWMWRNIDVLEFVEWLRTDNDRYPDAKVAFHGLDYRGKQSWNLRARHIRHPAGVDGAPRTHRPWPRVGAQLTPGRRSGDQHGRARAAQPGAVGT
jgi:erythromycin esterase-like protein